MSCRATVLIPTTAGRGPVLPYSVGSALNQTIRELEVIIIGDGVCDETRAVIDDLRKKDDRVRFFDFPKHESRGEPNRHRVLTAEARGEIVCYLCDRDMYLPGHVETMLRLLDGADFAHTLSYDMLPDDSIRVKTEMDIADDRDRRWILKGWEVGNGIPLTFAGHTMDLYRRLPHGWRTTPDGLYTDIYMWEQILAVDSCRAVSGYTPTVLYFPSYPRRGWGVEKRRRELAGWAEKMGRPRWREEFDLQLIEALGRDRVETARRLRRWRAPVRFARRWFGLRRFIRRAVRRVSS
jgi:glycosyltransferase involved in cell wall biosynthesis